MKKLKSRNHHHHHHQPEVMLRPFWKSLNYYFLFLRMTWERLQRTWAEILCLGTCLQLSWRRVVMRKWLNIPASDSDYSADTETESDSDEGHFFHHTASIYPCVRHIFVNFLWVLQNIVFGQKNRDSRMINPMEFSSMLMVTCFSLFISYQSFSKWLTLLLVN